MPLDNTSIPAPDQSLADLADLAARVRRLAAQLDALEVRAVDVTTAGQIMRGDVVYRPRENPRKH